MNRYWPSLLLATSLAIFFGLIAVSTSPAQNPSAQDQSAKVDGPLGQSHRRLEDDGDSAGCGQPAAAPWIADSRQRFQVTARYSGRLCSLRPLAAVSEARHCRTRAASGWQDFMGLFAH